MVEGPGATRNGDKIKAAMNRKILKIEVQSLENFCAEDYECCYLAEAFTVGKELFLIFAFPSSDEDKKDVAIRLHFGMNGCLYVGKNPRIPSYRQKEPFNLRLTFGCLHIPTKKIRTLDFTSNEQAGDIIDLTSESSPPNTLDQYIYQCQKINDQTRNCVQHERNAANHERAGNRQKGIEKKRKLGFDNNSSSQNMIIVETRNTSVSFGVSANVARLKLSRLHCRDVCSPTFHANQVFQVLRHQVNAKLIISDAILNQNYFPGVGNIIKIESLHKAKVDPRRFTSALSDLELRQIIAHCRRFSMSWYKNGYAPTKLVYNLTTCGTCHQNTVQMQKLGGGINDSKQIHCDDIHKESGYLSRVTFWCTFCQPFEPTCSNIKPSQNGNETNQGIDRQRNESLSSRLSCPKHGNQHVILRRVRAQNSPNFARIFRLCKKKDCEFFAWADMHFPSCHCKTRAVMKVSKTEKSGGKWFFCCRSKANQGCGYFQWVNSQQLQRIGTGLTPLL